MTRMLLASLLFCACLSSFAAPKTDSYYMREAIKIAQRNPQLAFGALIINNKSGEVLCTGLNSTQQKHNPTLHGEMVAINSCATKYPAMDWEHATLYTTAEPCPMCQTAVMWAHIPRVVFGTSIAYLQAHGWEPIKLTGAQLIKLAPFYHGTIKGGVLSNETNPMFAKGFVG